MVRKVLFCHPTSDADSRDETRDFFISLNSFPPVVLGIGVLLVVKGASKLLSQFCRALFDAAGDQSDVSKEFVVSADIGFVKTYKFGQIV